MISISHWGMFAGFYYAEAYNGGPGAHRAVWRPAHPDDMVGAW